MALRAGYYGVKRDDAEKLKKLPGITEIGTGLELEDGELSAPGAGTNVVPNPESGVPVGALDTVEIGDYVYTVAGGTYKITDQTESTISEGDYVPFLDSSVQQPNGLPRKSTWTNFVNKVMAKAKTSVTVTPGTDIELRPANTAGMIGSLLSMNLVLKNTGTGNKSSSDVLATISGLTVTHSNNLVAVGVKTADGTTKGFLFTHSSTDNTITVKILSGSFAPDETYAINLEEIL